LIGSVTIIGANAAIASDTEVCQEITTSSIWLFFRIVFENAISFWVNFE
jgi:hypothetical protein